ncbi:MAG: TonB-dependent receptor [Rhodanobacteraceae bacterium]
MRKSDFSIPVWRLSVAISAALLWAPSVHAQTTSPKAKSAGEARQKPAAAVTLGTIVVTANKRSQNVQDVPMAVSVMGGYELERMNATDFGDYLTKMPGVNVISGGDGQTQIVMRGITSGSRQPNASVGTYIDEAPFGSSTVYADGSLLTPDIDPSDLERVEVLRGPQGTLYGSNTLGGLIKFVTRPPDTTAFYGRVELDGTSVANGGNGFGTRVMLNAPLVTDKLAIRANVYKRNDPGYIDDIGRDVSDANEAKVDGGRVQLLWTPNGRVSLRMSALFQNLDSSGLANGGVDVDPYTLQPLYGRYVAKHPPGTGFFDLGYRLYDATLTADLGWAKLIATTSYDTLDLDQNFDLTNAYGPILGPVFGLPNPGFSELTPITQNKFTQEIRLQSPSTQKLEWRVGLFYTHEHSSYGETVLSFDSITGAPIQLPTLADINLGPALFTEKALYGDMTYHFTPRFDVLLGVRYTQDRTQYTQTGSGLLVGSSNFTTTGTDTPTTYLINPAFKLSDNVLLYGRIASGFRPGGPNVGVPPGLGAPVTFGPDKLVNYEVGLKSTLLQQRMTFDIDAYYIDWSQIQLETTIAGIGFLSNGGKAKSEGVEAAWAYRPVAGLTLSANASFTDAVLTQNTPPGLIGFKGDRLPYVPRWGANLGVEYDFPLANGWSGYAGGNYGYTGSRVTDFASVPNARFNLPAYKVLDLRAGINYGDWSFGIFVKNATNSRGVTILSFETIDPTASPYSATYVQPRLIGVTASVDF